MIEHVGDLIDAYELGTLDALTSRRVRAHLESCAQCRAAAGDVRAVFDALPHALELVEPPAGLRDRILTAIDTPRPQRWYRSSQRLPAVLAAALALALIGDGILSAALVRRGSPPIYVATTTPRPAVPQRPTAAPALMPTPQPILTRIVRTTPPARSPAPVSSSSALDERERRRMRALLAQNAALAAERDRAVAASRVLSTRDAGQIAFLRERLARSRQSSAAPQLIALVDALENGRIYAADGEVDHRAWHVTIVQQSPVSNAEIFTHAPAAPAGRTYRAWVLRDGKTYDAAVIPPGRDANVHMPMPLESGDTVAFSLEPESTGGLPTQPFLMQLKIAN